MITLNRDTTLDSLFDALSVRFASAADDVAAFRNLLASEEFDTEALTADSSEVVIKHMAPDKHKMIDGMRGWLAEQLQPVDLACVRSLRSAWRLRDFQHRLRVLVLAILRA